MWISGCATELLSQDLGWGGGRKGGVYILTSSSHNPFFFYFFILFYELFFIYFTCQPQFPSLLSSHSLPMPWLSPLPPHPLLCLHSDRGFLCARTKLGTVRLTVSAYLVLSGYHRSSVTAKIYWVLEYRTGSWPWVHELSVPTHQINGYFRSWEPLMPWVAANENYTSCYCSLIKSLKLHNKT